MRENSFGKMITLTSFGESHGPAIGVVIDGVPSQLKVSVDDLKAELLKRAPGKNEFTTSRSEEDVPEILSGVFEGKTLGTPIAVVVRNVDQKSSDYNNLKSSCRPGHADQTTIDKFGIRDHRGGGRSSGRETIARVIAGYFASLIIPFVKIRTEIVNVGPVNVNKPDLTEEAKQYLIDCKKKGESAGTAVKVVVSGLSAGIGGPVFDKLKADLAKAALSIGGCTSFAYGLGANFSRALGSDVSSDINCFGGIEGGISNGKDINFELTFKPPSTIGKKATSGRHDPCIVPRVVPVIVAMARVVLADHYLRQAAYNEFRSN